MTDSDASVDVVVVGAGLAGVMTARLLARAEKRVLVLEASERVGGRLLTRQTQAGLAVDLGGQWLGPGQDRMLDLAAELGMSTHPTGHVGKTCFEVAGTRGASRAGLPMSQPFCLLGLVVAMNRLEKETKRERAAASWQAEQDGASDVSVGEFVERHVWPTGARVVLRAAFEGIFCRNPDEVSMSLARYAMAASGGFAHMQAVQGGAQERQLSDGAGTLVERLASEVGDAIRLGTPVRRIQSSGGDVLIRADACNVRAKRVVVAIPPPLIARLDFDPPLSSARSEVLSATRMGSVTKYCLVYREPFWKQAGLSGALWSTSGPVSVCYDTTPAGSDHGVLSALSVAGAAERLAPLPPEQRKQSVVEALAIHLGPAAKTPLEFFETSWADEPYVGGGYSVTLPRGAFSRGPAVFREPHGLIHFAGTETASEYPGYMEGAVESAERVSREVLQELDAQVAE